MSLEGLLNRQNQQDYQHINGVVVGIVTNNHDPEGLGRVKVNFPWRGEKDESYWARITSLMAGNERGIVFYPEVDDEVLVAFEQGDVNHPYVIGALWNGKDKPPEANSDGKNNIRKITSRSGHEIIFNDDDEAKEEKIEIHTIGGHKIILDDSSGNEKIEIVDHTGDNKIIIDSAEKSINMESATQLTIKSNSVEIEGTESLALKSNTVEIEGTTSLTLKSDSDLTIKGLPVKIN